MDLTKRVALFFLLALAVMLAGFSLTLYFLARGHLIAQLDTRLDATLDVLAAAAEVEVDRVEWDPVEHRVEALAQGQWLVIDNSGGVVSSSRDISAITLSALTDAKHAEFETGQSQRCSVGGNRMSWRRVTGAGQMRSEPLDEDEYDALVLIAAAPLQPVEATLTALPVALTGLSIGSWLLAALVGRWLSRRSLAPLAAMAVATSSIDATDLSKRLPESDLGPDLATFCRAFNGLLERLEESFERQRRFTGDASHQLRTPLAALMGQLEVALRRERSSQEYRSVLEGALAEGQRLKGIVETLLMLARPGDDEPATRLQALDLQAWVPEWLKKWSSHERGKDIRCEFLAAGPLCVKTRADLLSQAMDNLIENSCKYSDNDTRITVQVGHDQEHVSIAVEDEGPGLTASEITMVFQPFFRADHARKSGKPGFGLGLAVVHRLVASLGGHIEVTSSPGKGSRFAIHFNVSLPRREVRPQVPPELTTFG